MEKCVHDGHRQRLKEEFWAKGFDENTPPHKIMEMLLFYSIPRKDTNEIAHNLINRFGGTVSGVLDASVEELVKVDGVSHHTAALIKLMVPIVRCYLTEKNEKKNVYSNLDEVCDFLVQKYISYTKEMFSVISFSGSGRKLGFDILGEGNVAEVNVSIREVVETAINRKAVSVIIAHNHPDGVAIPSQGDIAVTRKIQSALSHINIKLLDHIIIGGDDYVSLCQSRLYRDIFE